MTMKERNGEHPFGDAGQLLLLTLFLVVWTVDSFILQVSTWMTDFIPLRGRLFPAGVCLGIALILFGKAHFIVRRDRRAGDVVSTGPFRYVRHPLYPASLLAYLGCVLSTLSLISLALFGVIFLFHHYIAGYEEKLLEMKFGAAYLEYKNKTGRWIPKRLR